MAPTVTLCRAPSRPLPEVTVGFRCGLGGGGKPFACSGHGSGGIFAGRPPVRFHRSGLAGGGDTRYSSPSLPFSHRSSVSKGTSRNRGAESDAHQLRRHHNPLVVLEPGPRADEGGGAAIRAPKIDVFLGQDAELCGLVEEAPVIAVHYDVDWLATAEEIVDLVQVAERRRPPP